jgi:hypothetical protein
MRLTQGTITTMLTVTRTTVVALTVAVAVALTGCSAPSAEETPSASESRFKVALTHCNQSIASEGVEYADNGATLIMSTAGTETTTPSTDWDTVGCVLRELDASTATLNLITETRALDGRQEKTWKGIDASWTYHPNDGLNMTLEDTRLS